MYVVIRSDLDAPQQLVQAAHAAFEMGCRYPNPRADPYHLIALQARDERVLQELVVKAKFRGIELYAMDDSDLSVGLTAFATEPIPRSLGKLFSNLPLWQGAVR